MYYLGLAQISQGRRDQALESFRKAGSLEQQGKPQSAIVSASLERMQGGPRSTTISGNTFSNNGRSGLALTSFGNTVDPVRGAQNCNIVSNTFTGNGSTSSAEAILFSASQPPGTISTNQVHFNRIVGNFKGATYNGAETIHVENNWWGCNYGPGTGGGGCTGTPNALNGTGWFSAITQNYLMVTMGRLGVHLPLFIVHKSADSDS